MHICSFSSRMYLFYSSCRRRSLHARWPCGAHTLGSDATKLNQFACLCESLQHLLSGSREYSLVALQAQWCVFFESNLVLPPFLTKFFFPQRAQKGEKKHQTQQKIRILIPTVSSPWNYFCTCSVTFISVALITDASIFLSCFF